VWDRFDKREYDVAVSAGEQVSIALVATALRKMGYDARSFLGYQVPIKTDSAFSKASIMEVGKKRLLESLKKGQIPVVAGFQGIDPDGNVTTLGRGGSDTTAVAVAAALGADLCELNKEVDGVFTADPGICENARKLDRLSYEEMLELAGAGAKVMETRSVEFAMKYKVPVVVRNSFNELPGTIIKEEDENMEEVIVSAVTLDKKQAKVTITRVPDRPGIAASVFSPISEANISVDMIVQNVSHKGYADITFTVAKTDLKHTEEIARRVAKELGAEEILTDPNIAKLSVVGVGMKTHAGIASRMFNVLAKEGVNIQMISTSEIKISCVVDDKKGELAVRLVHDAFGLAKHPGKKQ
jgi:aspartate kinase